MKIRKFQDGGAVAAPDAQMAAQEQQMGAEQDPLMQILQLADQALQGQDCEAAMMVCQAFIALAQEAEGAAPMGEPMQEPVFKKGGKMVKEGKGIAKAMKTYSKQGKSGKSCK